MQFSYKVRSFGDLDPAELYAILRLRNEVFVVEQNCVYQDADNKDIYCHHLMLSDNKQLIAYARLVPPGISYREMSVGRVVTAKDERKKGAGSQLMKLAIDHCRKLCTSKFICSKQDSIRCCSYKDHGYLWYWCCATSLQWSININ